MRGAKDAERDQYPATYREATTSCHELRGRGRGEGKLQHCFIGRLKGTVQVESRLTTLKQHGEERVGPG